MSQTLAHLTLVVRDYDQAISFFSRALGFDVIEDTALGGGKRWVVVGPAAGRGCSLLLAKAASPEQLARVGDQTGGQVFLLLETDDFKRDYERLESQGVRFAEAPREEAYGTVVVFFDLYGNKWDLIERRGAST